MYYTYKVCVVMSQQIIFVIHDITYFGHKMYHILDMLHT